MESLLSDFKTATDRLKEVLKLSKTDTNRDSAILRFQLCFDLAWKSIKAFARKEGKECYSPRQCFKVGFQLGLIEHDQMWLKMIESRNEIVHTYQEKLAVSIYSYLKDYLDLFESLYIALAKAEKTSIKEFTMTKTSLPKKGTT